MQRGVLGHLFQQRLLHGRRSRAYMDVFTASAGISGPKACMFTDI